MGAILWQWRTIQMFCIIMWLLVTAKAANLTSSYFVFGDSLADVGNNNYLPFSLAKANYLPNGIDYKHGTPTGRFSNGRTAIDILAQLMGYPISLPYLAPSTKGKAIDQGVNYASGGCGILNETNTDKVECLSLSTQITYHEKTILSIVDQLGSSDANNFISSSPHFIAIGSNDILDNYLKTTADSKQYSPAEFENVLTASLGRELMRLYDLGARKFVFFGLGPLGCTPSQRAKHSINGACNDTVNSWVVEINVGIKSLLQDLNLKLANAQFSFANVYDLVQGFIENPSAYGFGVVNAACCGGGNLKAQIPCLPVLATVCSNRSDHLFWDPWHPTEATNLLLANSFFSGSLREIGPWNVKQLVQT